MKKVHVLICGRVQGVGFRYWVRGRMEKLGISGEVWNNDDGTVGAEFTGKAGEVKKLVDLCHQGPPLASVEKVVILKIE